MSPSSLTLYHGSKSGIVGPIRPSSRATCDFGRAFYMGESEHQPLTLICHAERPRLYTLEFDELCEKYRSGEGLPRC